MFSSITGGKVGHDIDGIGSDYQDRPRGVIKNTGNHFLEYCCISFQEIKTRFTRFLGDAGAYNYQSAVLQVFIIAPADLQRV
jgi:hypothetical protein